MGVCCYCKKVEDTRPYGPGFADVCHACATATPEREKEARRNFFAQLDACGPKVMICGEAGPVPVDGKGRGRA